MTTKRLFRLFLLLILLSTACGLPFPSDGGGKSPAVPPSPSPAPTQPAPVATATALPTAANPVTFWKPGLDATWQWQLTGAPIDSSFDVAVYDIDLFDNDASVVASLHAQGRKVVCYISVGSWEDWRPDREQFPASVIGKDYQGWPGEKWLDIRQIELLAPLMRARLDLCRAKGFDAIEPDNIDGYTNDTGFPLTYADQLKYNRWLADEAHARGLSIGLKNDPDQAADLVAVYDWAMTEDCFDQGWCEQMLPFIQSGKPVFAVEYTDTGITLEQFCPQAQLLGFSALLKNRELDAWRENCPAAAANTAPVTATAAPTAAPQAFDKWSLWSGGTQLRGANIYQRRVFLELDGGEYMGPGPFGPPYAQADFDNLAALGANYVNLSLAGLYTVQPPYIVDEEAVANLDRLLEMAAQAHLYAVITFRTGPGRSEFSIIGGDWVDRSYIIETVWTDPAAQAAWADMWRFAAQRYRANPAVAGYDLMCEPNSNGMLDIWDGQAFYESYAGGGYDWNAWYPSLVDAIREVDGETPILVSAMSFGDLAWLPYLQVVADPRVVYTFHQYSPHEYTHQEVDQGYTYPGRFDTDYDGRAETFDLAWLEHWLSLAGGWAADNDRPLAVNEYGAIRWAAGGTQYLRDEMNLFEDYGWNYAIWAWYPDFPPLAEGDHSFNFRLGPDAANLTLQASNDILEMLRTFWARNTSRP
jgi:hypothetical protein